MIFGCETNFKSNFCRSEIFSIERRFQRSKSPPSNFKATHAPVIEERYPIKVVILSLLASLAWKRLQVGMVVLSITTSPSDELFHHINIDDFERPWTPKIRGFIVFLLSSAVPHTSRVDCDKMAWDRLRQFGNRNCYRLPRISWALAPISCINLMLDCCELHSSFSLIMLIGQSPSLCSVCHNHCCQVNGVDGIDPIFSGLMAQRVFLFVCLWTVDQSVGAV